MTQRSEHDPVPESEIPDALHDEQWTLREGQAISDSSRRRALRLARALIPGYAARERDAAEREAARVRSEASRRCSCSPRPERHHLRVWLAPRHDGLDMYFDDVDAAHNAKADVEHAVTLYEMRSEFVYPPMVDIDGRASVVTAHVLALQLSSMSNSSPRVRSPR